MQSQAGIFPFSPPLGGVALSRDWTLHKEGKNPAVQWSHGTAVDLQSNC